MLANAVSKAIQFTFFSAFLLGDQFIGNELGQAKLARRMRNKDVSHLNAFCHSYLRHMHHRSRVCENGYLNLALSQIVGLILPLPFVPFFVVACFFSDMGGKCACLHRCTSCRRKVTSILTTGHFFYLFKLCTY